MLRLSRNIAPSAQAQFGRADGQILHGAALDGPVAFQESGLRFEADVLRGQKTGFFWTSGRIGGRWNRWRRDGGC